VVFTTQEHVLAVAHRDRARRRAGPEAGAAGKTEGGQAGGSGWRRRVAGAVGGAGGGRAGGGGDVFLLVEDTGVRGE
jgi:hypothetical protein